MLGFTPDMFRLNGQKAQWALIPIIALMLIGTCAHPMIWMEGENVARFEGWPVMQRYAEIVQYMLAASMFVMSVAIPLRRRSMILAEWAATVAFVIALSSQLVWLNGLPVTYLASNVATNLPAFDVVFASRLVYICDLVIAATAVWLVAALASIFGVYTIAYFEKISPSAASVPEKS